MVRRPLRIATTAQLERSVREAGYEAHVLPQPFDLDIHMPIARRIELGAVHRPFLEKHDVDLIVDFNTTALTLCRASSDPDNMALTGADLGIPYVSCYLDPITSTMNQVAWGDHWHLLESPMWIKWIFERAHGEELMKLGIPNVVIMPMAAANEDYDTSPLPEPVKSPAVAFMGHPASSWFTSGQAIQSSQLFAGLTAAAVHADMPDLAFHQIYYDLYQFGEPPQPGEDRATRANKALEYYNRKFVYQAFLAVKRRDRFARFLKLKLGDAFELIGDHWNSHYGLDHTPRIWDRRVLLDRMRRVPVCLNLYKGNIESGLILRPFEVTAAGGLLLTYPTAELGNCFAIGEECDVFHNEEELLQKIGFYLAHPQKRRDIAAAGQRRTLSQHLYSHRIGSLVELLEKANVLPRRGGSADATKPIQRMEPREPIAAGVAGLAGVAEHAAD